MLLIPPVSRRGIELPCAEASAIDTCVVGNSRSGDRHHDPAKDICPRSVDVLPSASHPHSPGKRVENAVSPSKRVTARLPVTSVTALSVLRIVLTGGRTHLLNV